MRKNVGCLQLQNYIFLANLLITDDRNEKPVIIVILEKAIRVLNLLYYIKKKQFYIRSNLK